MIEHCLHGCFLSFSDSVSMCIVYMRRTVVYDLLFFGQSFYACERYAHSANALDRFTTGHESLEICASVLAHLSNRKLIYAYFKLLHRCCRGIGCSRRFGTRTLISFHFPHFACTLGAMAEEGSFSARRYLLYYLYINCTILFTLWARSVESFAMAHQYQS